MSTSSGDVNTHASSTGHALSGGDWLDVHFEADRPEYEAMLRSAGFQPGWHVLDAGCGSGGFLPLIAEAVGASGRITAFDLAPDNIAIVARRAAEWRDAPPIESQVGSLLDLPYADDSFDAVWCANTTQYLTDDELATALGEFRRVVRPGGIVVVKEFDGTMPSIVPAPPLLLVHMCEVTLAQWKGAGNGMRTPALAGWLRRAGLVQVWQRRVLSERSAPLGRYERRFWGDWLALSAHIAPRIDLPAVDQAFWERLADLGEMDRLLDDPDCYCCEGHIVAVGTVP